MIYEKICKAREYPAVQTLLAFFDGEIFPVVYAVLTLLCSFLGFEIAFFALTAVIFWFVTLFGKDSKPVIAPLVLFIYAISQRHTSQPPYSSDFLYGVPFLATSCTLAAITFALFLFRLIVYPSTDSVIKGKPVMRWGLLALAAALLLNGAFYSEYTFSDFLLGAAIAFSFVFFYVYFYHTLIWRDTTALSVARVLTLACAVIMLQLAEMYLFDGVIVDGSIDKDKIILGWGMSNNVGGMLAMFLPAPFYLAYREKHGWLYYLLGLLVFLGVVLTCSRTSVLVGAIILLVILVLLAIRGKNVCAIRIIDVVLAVCAVVACVVFRDKLAELFEHYIERGFDDTGRFEIWAHGWNNFLKAPLFGVGFYTPIAPDWSYNIENWLFPDMYHNTFVQMLASCGILGAVAYSFHVCQGLYLCFRKPTSERLFFFFVIAILSGMSLADNHIVHVFPALVYSMLLAFCEKDFAQAKAAEPPRTAEEATEDNVAEEAADGAPSDGKGERA